MVNKYCRKLYESSGFGIPTVIKDLDNLIDNLEADGVSEDYIEDLLVIKKYLQNVYNSLRSCAVDVGLYD